MNAMFETVVDSNTGEVKEALTELAQRAYATIGFVAEGYAKRLCPVDTGRLRNSITHTYDEEGVYIGTNVEYAPYVELGTSRMKARPFLKPAAEDHANEYAAILQDILSGTETA